MNLCAKFVRGYEEFFDLSILFLPAVSTFVFSFLIFCSSLSILFVYLFLSSLVQIKDPIDSRSRGSGTSNTSSRGGGRTGTDRHGGRGSANQFGSSGMQLMGV